MTRRYISQRQAARRPGMPTFTTTPKGPYTLELIDFCANLKACKSKADYEKVVSDIGGIQVLQDKIEDNGASIEFSENEWSTARESDGRTRTKVGPKIQRNGKTCLDPANATVWAGARVLKHPSTDPDFAMKDPLKGALICRTYPAGYVPRAFVQMPNLAPQILNVVDNAQADYAATLSAQETEAEDSATDKVEEEAGVAVPKGGEEDFPPIA